MLVPKQADPAVASTGVCLGVCVRGFLADATAGVLLQRDRDGFRSRYLLIDSEVLSQVSYAAKGWLGATNVRHHSLDRSCGSSNQGCAWFSLPKKNWWVVSCSQWLGVLPTAGACQQSVPYTTTPVRELEGWTIPYSTVATTCPAPTPGFGTWLVPPLRQELNLCLSPLQTG